MSTIELEKIMVEDISLNQPSRTCLKVVCMGEKRHQAPPQNEITDRDYKSCPCVHGGKSSDGQNRNWTPVWGIRVRRGNITRSTPLIQRIARSRYLMSNCPGNET